MSTLQPQPQLDTTEYEPPWPTTASVYAGWTALACLLACVLYAVVRRVSRSVRGFLLHREWARSLHTTAQYREAMLGALTTGELLRVRVLLTLAHHRPLFVDSPHFVSRNGSCSVGELVCGACMLLAEEQTWKMQRMWTVDERGGCESSAGNGGVGLR
jgi:hypothetical protein